MAVDTRDKRASVLGLGLAALLVLPQPTAIDQGDRQQLAYTYRGIAADTPAASPDADPIIVTVSAMNRVFSVRAAGRLIDVPADGRSIVVGDKP